MPLREDSRDFTFDVRDDLVFVIRKWRIIFLVHQVKMGSMQRQYAIGRKIVIVFFQSCQYALGKFSIRSL